MVACSSNGRHHVCKRFMYVTEHKSIICSLLAVLFLSFLKQIFPLLKLLCSCLISALLLPFCSISLQLFLCLKHFGAKCLLFKCSRNKLKTWLVLHFNDYCNAQSNFAKYKVCERKNIMAMLLHSTRQHLKIV